MSWTHQDGRDLYNVGQWGSGYFDVDTSGNVLVRPGGRDEGSPQIELAELIRQIRRRGVSPPILLRFNDILRARVREIHEAFDRARTEFGYQAPYHCVFPIKVNQQRHLVDTLLAEGGRFGMGIEVGSKPELLAVMALHADEGRIMVCNGYKDRAYVETAMLTRRLGTLPILVIEKFSELGTILRASKDLGIRPILGVRTKLGLTGSGRWKESGGDRSKFGLTTRQIVQVVETLREHEMLDCLQLLHFHLGSQITHIRAVKKALVEATRTLTSLVGMGAPIGYFDVGGGLGIDYDGSSTDFESSINYSVQEYANDIVYHTREACEEAGIPQPVLLSESGRALTAHHAVLIAEVVGVSRFSQEGPERVEEDEAETIQQISRVADGVTAKNFLESYHDALELREEAMTLFNVGQLSLAERARVEEFFWLSCQKILKIIRGLEYVPDDIERLERDMADTYYLNFSVFQSMPDSWAIHQLFPVLPLHRLNEEPTRRGVLADITCDSDGKVDRFIDLRDVKRVLELHPLLEGEPYYLGFFLVGAYQEILGDLHNLFGDTHVVHVDVGEDGRPRISHIVPGDDVQEVLSYVEYFRGDLLDGLRKKIERAIDKDQLSLEDSAALTRRFEEGLASYTYLITREDATPETP